MWQDLLKHFLHFKQIAVSPSYNKTKENKLPYLISDKYIHKNKEENGENVSDRESEGSQFLSSLNRNIKGTKYSKKSKRSVAPSRAWLASDYMAEPLVFLSFFDLRRLENHLDCSIKDSLNILKRKEGINISIHFKEANGWNKPYKRIAVMLSQK